MAVASRRREEDELALGVGKYYDSEREDLWGKVNRNASTGGMSSLIDPSAPKSTSVTPTQTGGSYGSSVYTSGSVKSGSRSGTGGNTGGTGGNTNGPAGPNSGGGWNAGTGMGLPGAVSSTIGGLVSVGASLMGAPAPGILGNIAKAITSEEGINENVTTNIGVMAAIPGAGIVKAIGDLTGLYSINYGDMLADITGQNILRSPESMMSELTLQALSTDDTMASALMFSVDPNITRTDIANFLNAEVPNRKNQEELDALVASIQAQPPTEAVTAVTDPTATVTNAMTSVTDAMMSVSDPTSTPSNNVSEGQSYGTPDSSVSYGDGNTFGNHYSGPVGDESQGDDSDGQGHAGNGDPNGSGNHGDGNDGGDE